MAGDANLPSPDAQEMPLLVAIVPDPVLTPGRSGRLTLLTSAATEPDELRSWSRERDDHIMAEYHLPSGPHPDYEIDHLVPLGVGGADDDRNLWPEPRRSIEPVWNAETKDRLEFRLREMVCSGEADVAEAQKAFTDDWTEAYRRYFGSK